AQQVEQSVGQVSGGGGEHHDATAPVLCAVAKEIPLQECQLMMLSAVQQEVRNALLVRSSPKAQRLKGSGQDGGMYVQVPRIRDARRPSAAWFTARHIPDRCGEPGDVAIVVGA